MITLYIGKSASGKDTYLKKQIKCGVEPIISYTTRPMRVNEENGVDYNFVTADEFLELDKQGKLMETRVYNTVFNGIPATWAYGSPKVDPDKDLVAIVDIKGAKSYIKEYGPKNINIVYVYADDDIREERARQRGTFSIEEWNRRFAADICDFSYAELNSLIEMLGKPITVLNNNGRTPTMSIKRSFGKDEG